MDLKRNGFVSKDLFIKEMHEAFDSEEEYFRYMTTFRNETLEKYKILLSELKDINEKKGSTRHEQAEITVKKGKALEELVKFILKNSIFFDVNGNVPTSTNEIDQVISLSFKGKRMMETANISPETLGLEGTYFLGECKNYHKKVGSTWVGKFYTLMKVCGNCRLGIIFSYHGLSGDKDKWNDAHGLTKILYQLDSNKENKYILEFNKDDYEKLATGKSFFDLLNKKKLELQIGAKVENYNIRHESEGKIKKIVDEVNND